MDGIRGRLAALGPAGGLASVTTCSLVPAVSFLVALMVAEWSAGKGVASPFWQR